MPAHALAPSCGWTVMDCCAAPGNKTTHAAALLAAAGASAGPAHVSTERALHTCWRKVWPAAAGHCCGRSVASIRTATACTLASPPKCRQSTTRPHICRQFTSVLLFSTEMARVSSRSKARLHHSMAQYIALPLRSDASDTPTTESNTTNSTQLTMAAASHVRASAQACT
eukprot:364898-Chlamydomonas_euryale.AAC.2